jgi:hypothetical protein
LLATAAPHSPVSGSMATIENVAEISGAALASSDRAVAADDKSAIAVINTTDARE